MSKIMKTFIMKVIWICCDRVWGARRREEEKLLTILSLKNLTEGWVISSCHVLKLQSYLLNHFIIVVLHQYFQYH